jgi:hypothetical protein
MKYVLLTLLILCWMVRGNAQVTGGPFLSTSFMSQKKITTGIYPHSVVPADFNGDGKVDLFVARGSSSNNTVLINTSPGGGAAGGGAISFAAPLLLSNAGVDEEGAAAGDLDGDGKPDIVVTNGVGAASVTIYRNTSTGGVASFTPGLNLLVVNGPYDVTIGDLDGDGKPDLIIPNNGANQVSFFRNTSTPGNLTFAQRMDITVGTSPFGVAIGDLDGDGKPDLVVNGEGPNDSLYVLQNLSVSGSLSFGNPVNVAFTGGFNPVIADFDGDGKLDVAATAYGILVLRNTSTLGHISFAPSQTFDQGAYVYYLAAGDLDGDGKPDLAAAIGFAGNIAVALHNTSTPGTISFQNAVSYGVGSDPRYLALGDLDGDGRPDMVVANTADTAISILQNLIGANVAPVITAFTPDTAVSGTIVQITGSNFSGITGVAFGGVPASSFSVNSATSITATVGNGASGNVSVMNAYGTASIGGFFFAGPVISRFAPAVGNAGTVVKISGVNFTGVTSVAFGGVPAASFTVDSAEGITAVVGPGASGSVTVVAANGTAALPGFIFGVPVVTNVAPLAAPVGATVVISGMNFRGTPSANIVYFGAVRALVVAATSTQLTVTVPAGATYQPVSVTVNGLTGTSPNAFTVTRAHVLPPIDTNSFSLAGSFAVGAWPRGVKVMDLDGDGKPDLLTPNSNSNSVSLLPNQSTIGLLQFGAHIDLPAGSDPTAIATGDLDGDGRPDIAAINFNAGNYSTVSVYVNKSTPGNFSFSPKTDISTGQGSTDVAIADLNGDGKPDLIVLSGNSGTLTVFTNTTVVAGQPTFGPPQNYTAFNHSTTVAVVDIDQDGRPDLVTADFNNTVTIFRNMSSGGVLSLLPQTPMTLNGNPEYIVAGDLDGDGLPDALVSNLTSVTLYQNVSGTGNLQLWTIGGEVVPATSMGLADFNGDGRVDLCAGHATDGNISVLQNTSTGIGSFAFAQPVSFASGSYQNFANAGDLDGDGKADVVVANPYGNSVSVLRNIMGEPAVISVTPDSAFSGDTVTITGRNFSGVTAVRFGGLAADSFSVVNSTTIRARIGGGASGVVEVQNPFGTGRLGTAGTGGGSGSGGSGGGSGSGGFRFIPQVMAGGNTLLCPGASVTLSSTATSNNQWYKNGSALAGDTTALLQVSDAGSYVVAVQSEGIVTRSAGVVVNVVNVNPPVVTRDAAGDLVSSDSTGNQWLLNGVAIPGATARVYHPDQPGVYTVVSTVADCSSAPSLPYSLALKGQIDIGSGKYISLVPNPVQNSLSLYWNAAGSSLDAAIADPQGRVLKTLYNVPNGTVVDLTGLPKGIYYVKIYSLDGVTINKTIKILKIE